MKSKRLLSVLLAAAMIAGTTPVSVFAGRLNPEETEPTQITEPEEKEPTKPAEKETEPEAKETEAPKETEPEVKETEEPKAEETEEAGKEDPKEPEEGEKTEEKAEEKAPEESEKPVENSPEDSEKPASEDPEESGKPAEKTHKVTAKNAVISNVAVSEDGTLTWDAVSGANGYSVSVNEYTSYFDVSYGTQVDLKKEIDYDIKTGLIKKTSNNTYKVKIKATKYNSETQADDVIAESDELAYVYKTSAAFIKVGTFSGIKMSGKNLVWNKIKGAVYYDVYFDGKQTTTVNSYELGTVIDDLIANRYIYKSCNDKYNVILYAYDCDDVMLAEWDGLVTYKTNAAPPTLPSLSNVSISKDGILTWDAYSTATFYSARIVGTNDYTWAYSDDGVSRVIDLKKNILEAVNNNGFEELSTYKIELYGYDANGEVAQFDLTYKYKEANTLYVKAKKTYKVKASKVKKKNQSIKRSKVLTIKNNKGSLSFYKVSGNAKIVINATSGKITVKKKLKKGTYKVQVRVKAAGNSTYAQSTKTVTIKIKVK